MAIEMFSLLAPEMVRSEMQTLIIGHPADRLLKSSGTFLRSCDYGGEVANSFSVTPLGSLQDPVQT
jgi:hypothetical protein